MALDTPFDAPPFPDAKPMVVQPNEEDKFQTVLKHFSDPNYRVSGEAEPEKGQLTDEEKYWLSKECILRYLRATRWDVAQAISRLSGSLSWRRSYGFYTPNFPSHVEPEGLTGKCLQLGYDVAARPCLYLMPSKQNTETSDRQLEYTFFIFERTIDLMPAGVENLALLINFGDKGSKSPPMYQARKMLNILQTHYPERLGKGLVINIPWLVNTFLSLIMPFVDPITRTKIHFNPDVITENLVSRDMLIREWGGDIDFTYDHSKYWPTLLRLAASHKEANMRRWHALGASVGISEWDYKDGDGEFASERMEKAVIPDGVGVPATSAVEGIESARTAVAEA